jgi:WhiB family redox-sensing transcriptional regulator
MLEQMMQSIDPLPDLTDLLRRPAWQARSACRGQGIRKFFPGEGRAVIRETRHLCAGCQVSEECLTFALGNPSLKGVWAGTSERARRQMRAAERHESC